MSQHIAVNIEIGEFTITVNSSDSLTWWLENSLGDGIEISVLEIETMMEDYFNANQERVK